MTRAAIAAISATTILLALAAGQSDASRVASRRTVLGSGRILYEVSMKFGESTWLESSALDGTDRHLLTRHSRGRSDSGSLSPDGTRVAFVRSNNSSSALFVINADGSGMTRLIGARELGKSISSGPVWSPDGSRVAFSTGDQCETPSHLYSIGQDGSGLLRLDATPRGVGPRDWVGLYPEAWSSDGNRVLYTVDDARGNDDCSRNAFETAYSIRARGGGRRRLFAALAGGDALFGEVAWSPDGRRIAFSVEAETGPTPCGFYVAKSGLKGLRAYTNRVRSTGYHCTSFVWHPSGDSLVLDDGKHVSRVAVVGGQRLRVFPGPRRPAWCFRGPNSGTCSDDVRAISADGQTVAVLSEKLNRSDVVYVTSIDGSGWWRVPARPGKGWIRDVSIHLN